MRGKGGDISIEAKDVSVRESGSISADTGSLADAGNITIRATDFVEVSGEKPAGDDRRFPSSLSTAVGNPDAVGKAGNLVIETGRFSITDGAQVLSATFGKGDAGDITIRATDLVNLTGASPVTARVSSLSTSVGEQAIGKGGDLTIETKKLQVDRGAQIFTSTLGNGNSGNFTVRASDAVVVSGVSVVDATASGLFASAEAGAVGQGGTLRIETGDLLVRDNARITVRDRSGTVGAGNLQILANSVQLDNQGLLNAETRAGVQGNIDIQSSSLLLRNNSRIQADAFNTATGGNISIDTGALAALGNSDITANAQQAVGGRVVINSQGIFGTTFQPELTSSSDITASSELGAEFSGTVEIKTPDIDASKGLVTLSSSPIDVSKLVVQRCLIDRRSNEFIITGRGGLPPSPAQVLSSNRVLEDLGVDRSLIDRQSSKSDDPAQTSPLSLVEAQTWIKNANGEVALVALKPESSLIPIWQTRNECSK